MPRYYVVVNNSDNDTPTVHPVNDDELGLRDLADALEKFVKWANAHHEVNGHTVQYVRTSYLEWRTYVKVGVTYRWTNFMLARGSGSVDIALEHFKTV